MDLKAKYQNMGSRQRIALLGTVGTVVVLFAYYAVFPRQVTAPPPSPQSKLDFKKGEAMPKGYRPGLVVRDPFLPSQEFSNGKGGSNVPLPGAGSPVELPVRAAGGGGQAAQGSAAPVSPAQTFLQSARLTGVLEGGGRRMAIIEYEGQSRSYAVQDYVGPYQLLAVYPESATLWGPGGKLVLTLGR